MGTKEFIFIGTSLALLLGVILGIYFWKDLDAKKMLRAFKNSWSQKTQAWRKKAGQWWYKTIVKRVRAIRISWRWKKKAWQKKIKRRWHKTVTRRFHAFKISQGWKKKTRATAKNQKKEARRSKKPRRKRWLWFALAILPILFFSVIALAVYLFVKGEIPPLPRWVWIPVPIIVTVLLGIVGLIARRMWRILHKKRQGEKKAVEKSWWEKTLDKSLGSFSSLVLWIIAIACLALFNAVCYRFFPDGWHKRATETPFLWWFWGTQIVFLLLAIAPSIRKSKRKRNSVKLAGALGWAFVGVSLAFFFGSFGSEGVAGATEAKLRSVAETAKAKESEVVRTIGPATMRLVWPPGFTNLLYGENSEGPWRTEVLQNDEDVFEFIVYSRFGNVLAKYRWDRKVQGSGWWHDEGTPTGREEDTGGWTLAPTRIPGLYIGSWWSQKQTGGKEITMKLQMQ